MPELVLGIIAIVATTLYARENYLRKNQREKTLEQALNINKNFNELNEEVEKSKQFLTQAEQEIKDKLDEALETESVQTNKLLEKSQIEFEVLDETFKHFLKDLEKKGETDYLNALNSFNSYLEQLKIASKNSEVASLQEARTRINQLFENFETKLADFLLQTEQKMMLAIDLELRSARQLIDTYKVQQMNVVDENIAAMLEKTLALVLAKNLNLKDQMSLVYESLEKAKAEKFIV